ncbi:MAG: tetratricopeptide repeat protein [Planctomycetota bacterium]
MPVGFRATCLTELGSAAGAEASRSLINSCIQAASLGAVGSLLVNPVTAGIVGVGLIAGGVYLDARRAKKSKAELDTSLTELLHAIHTKGQELDAYIDRIEHAKGGPNAVAAELADAVHAEGAETRAHIDEWMESIRIYLSTMSADLRETRDTTRKLKAGQQHTHDTQQQILDGQARQDAKLDELTTHFMGQLRQKDDQLAELGAANESLRMQVRGALERVAQVERSAGRDPLAKLDELRGGDPHRLLEFLDDQLEDDERELIDKHRERAAVAFVVGEITKAEASLKKVLALHPNDLSAMNDLGHIARLRGDFTEAERLYSVLLETSEQRSDHATALGNLGVIELTRGDLEAAEDYLKRSLAIDEVLRRSPGIASTLGNLGLIQLTRGSLHAAEDYFKRSLAIDQALDRKEGIANQLGNLGGVELVRGNLEAAEDYLKRSLLTNEKLGHKSGVANQLGNLGLVEFERGNLDAAEGHHKRSLKINEQLGRKEGVASQLGNLGLIEQTRGNLEAAEAYLKRSLAISEQLDHNEGVAKQLGNLGGIELARGDLGAAEGYINRSLTISEAMGRKDGMAKQLTNLGLTELARGNSDATRRHWTQAHDLFAEIEMPHMVQRVQSLIDRLPPD